MRKFTLLFAITASVFFLNATVHFDENFNYADGILAPNWVASGTIGTFTNWQIGGSALTYSNSGGTPALAGQGKAVSASYVTPYGASNYLNFKQTLGLAAQTAINTSFEAEQGYTLGTVNNKNSWKVTSGNGEIVNVAEYIKEGTQALKIFANATALQVDNIAFASNAIGLGGDVYVDFWIKLKSLPSVNLGVSGYDLGTNTHRSFMIEFQPNGK